MRRAGRLNPLASAATPGGMFRPTPNPLDVGARTLPPMTSLATNHMPLNLASHHLASHLASLDEIQGRIRSIEAEVLQARLVVKCLEFSIGCSRNLLPTEYDAILSQYGNAGFVRNFTAIADFTQEKAKAKREKAKAKLEKAKAETAFSKGVYPAGSMTSVCRRTVASAVVGFASSMPSAPITPQQVRHASTKKATKAAASTRPKTILMDAVATARTDVSTARSYIDSANQAVASALLEVFDAHVGVAMLKCGSAKVTPTIIPYDRFVGYDPAIHSVAYVGGLLKAYKDQSVKEAETKLKEAKAELKEAETKLKEAKAELEKAEVKLKEAEVKLEKAEVKLEKMMIRGPERDFDSVLAQSEGFSLRVLDTRKAVDVLEFAKFMKDKVNMAKISGFNQDSLAVVLRSASGVGKTFASLAMTYPLFEDKSFKYFPIAVYIGLNSMCSLTSEEEHRLRDEKSLEHVLLRRLLIQLNYLASPTVKIDESLWDVDTKIQKMPLPPKEKGWSSCKYHFSDHVSTLDMQTKVTALLGTIASKVGKQIVLFPIVDEGQFLDELCAKKKAKWGARFALRIIRSLQSSTFPQHKVLGLMTGIDPEVYLNRTNGRNECYGHPLHSPEGFKEITSALFAERRFSDTQVARIAAVMYPHVRELRDLAINRKSTPQAFEMDEKGVRPVRLLLASGSNERIQIPWTQDVPAVFPAVDSVGPLGLGFIPVLGIRHVAAVAKELGGLPFSIDLLLEFALSPQPNFFESITSFCLPMLLVLQNFKLGGRHKPLVRFQFIKKHVQDWLKVGFPVRFVQLVPVEYGKLAYFPSSGHFNSHAKAFCVSGGTSPALHKQFNLDELITCGDTVLMNCGGDAPVDMIYVTLVRKATKTVKAELQIRLCDAKLVVKAANDRGHLRSMQGRFEMVKLYLEHHLKGEFELKFLPFAIVTTSPNADYPLPSDIVVISPATCAFSPLTDMWFAT